MTGQGRGECVSNGRHVTVEIASVNRKQAEFNFNFPRSFDGLEPRLRDLVGMSVSRGRVSIKVSLEMSDGGAPVHARLNRRLVKTYVDDLRQLACELSLDPAISIGTILGLPGVLETDQTEEDLEAIWLPLRHATESALAGMLAMREREGANLARDLVSRVEGMKAAVGAVRAQAPEVCQRFRAQLIEKLRSAGAHVGNPEDDRLMKEIVFFADRSDISEELARLESHFEQFQDCLNSSEPVGRTLDFLAQEMNREINTIGSKANDSVISKNVVTLKTELERFREQAQNVE